MLRQSVIVSSALLLACGCAARPAPQASPEPAEPSRPGARATSEPAASQPAPKTQASDGASGARLLLHLDASRGYADGTWSDQGEGGHAAVAASEKARPERIDGAIAGRPALAFDGTDDSLTSPLDISPDAHPAVTVFVVFKSDASGGRHKLYGNDNGGYDRTVGLDERAATNLTYFSGDDVEPYADIDTGTWYLATQSYTGSSLSAWLDGELVVDGRPTSYGGAKDSLTIGSDGDDSYYWEGAIAEVRVYEDALSGAERERIEAELTDTYDL